MGMLPLTLIFVLSASLIVALIYLPVVGGVSGRLSRIYHGFECPAGSTALVRPRGSGPACFVVHVRGCHANREPRFIW